VADSLPAHLPAPRTADPRTAPALRWGILAPGWIARGWVSAVRTNTSQNIVAVGSRDLARAQAFAADFGIERAYGSYEELVADPQIDVIYIASPHSEHHRQALLAIAAGKHVLVEKAFTQTAAQAAEVGEAAAAANVLVLEAMWTRFLPHIDVVRQLLADGVLGDIVAITADHGQHMTPAANNRLFDPHLAGGALLDLGIYPISFASFVQGEPSAVSAVGVKAETGVDGQVSIVLSSGSQTQALLNTTLFAKTATTATIAGTRARIEIPGDFYGPQPITVIDTAGDRRVWDGNTILGHQGLAYEAAEVARLVTAGRTESDLLPPAETVSIMRTIDEVRRQIGVVLPGD
jgi:predicted dehydrogenase